jgi:hypothetical protein
MRRWKWRFLCDCATRRAYSTVRSGARASLSALAHTNYTLRVSRIFFTPLYLCKSSFYINRYNYDDPWAWIQGDQACFVLEALRVEGIHRALRNTLWVILKINSEYESIFPNHTLSCLKFTCTMWALVRVDSMVELNEVVVWFNNI